MLYVYARTLLDRAYSNACSKDLILTCALFLSLPESQDQEEQGEVQ